MKKYIKIFFLPLSVFSLLVFSGCEKDFLDVNDDPNNPLEVPLNQLLPAVQVQLASATGQGGLSSIASYYMQQNVTRGTLNDWNIDPGTAAGSWNVLYQDCLTDMREMINIGTEKEYWHYVGMAKIMKAYSFSILVDLWGDVPFTEANLGSVNPTPVFDNGEDIYDALIAMLDEGMADLDKEAGLAVRGDDLIYGGDVDLWKKFANTLKLKMYNQMRGVRNVNAEINALLGTPANLIASQAEDFELPYGTSSNPDDRNPSYAGSYSPGSKPYPNPYFYEVMRGENSFHGNTIFAGISDPRIPYYFYNQLVPGESAQNPTAYHNTGTGFVSIYSFSFNIHPNEGFDQSESQSVMGLFPIGGRFDNGSGATANNNGYASTPQRMLTNYNRLFIEAELALAGVSGGDDATLLVAAINASFAKVNQVATSAGAPLISDAARDNYRNAIMAIYNNAGTSDEQRLEIIMTQKWISSYGFAVDAFSDFRRTGYPTLHDGNTDNLPTTSRNRDIIVSFPYPTNEIELNPKSPGQRNPYLSKVFWDN